MHLRRLAAYLTLAMSLIPTTGYSWAERGHGTIARVATRLLIERVAADRPQLLPLLTKEYLLSHLANIPDIQWRVDSATVIAGNAPTHFFHADFAGPQVTWESLPKSIVQLEAQLVAFCAAPTGGLKCPNDGDPNKALTADLVGTAPWRVRQLTEMMRQGFAAAKALPMGSVEAKSAIDQALLAGGLLAHFVGDLANPDHVTQDADGYDVGQGGIHVYFEDDVVEAVDLNLEADVFTAALFDRPALALETRVPTPLAPTLASSPLALALALSLDSYTHLSELNALDRTYALISPSRTDHGMRIPATRRPAAEVAAKMRPLIVARLAIGADALAQIWRTAWEGGGKPDLSAYSSKVYPLAPTFIPADYLRGDQATRGL